jgi:hypothetical protein
VRSNYDSLATAIAQVVPVLMIAVYIENRLLPRDRSARFYPTFGLVAGWFAILASFAYLADETPETDDATTRGFLLLWFVSISILAGSLVGTARAAMRRSAYASRSNGGQPDGGKASIEPARPPRLLTLILLVLLWRRRR